MKPAADLTAAEVDQGTTSLASALGTSGGALEPERLKERFKEAWEIVRGEVGEENPPPIVLSRAVREVAVELWHRDRAPGGALSVFGNVDSPPARLAKDPMTAARTILRAWLPGGFA